MRRAPLDDYALELYVASKTAAVSISVAERRQYVLELRKQGKTYAQIAAETTRHFGANNLPKSWCDRFAYNDVSAELARIREDTREVAEELVQIEVERLDKALAAIEPKVTEGQLGAIDRWIRLSETRRKLLGLDQPHETKVTGEVNVDLTWRDVVDAAREDYDPDS